MFWTGIGQVKHNLTVCVCVCMHACIYLCICVYNIYIYIHIHTYILDPQATSAPVAQKQPGDATGDYGEGSDGYGYGEGNATGVLGARSPCVTRAHARAEKGGLCGCVCVGLCIYVYKSG